MTDKNLNSNLVKETDCLSPLYLNTAAGQHPASDRIILLKTEA